MATVKSKSPRRPKAEAGPQAEIARTDVLTLAEAAAFLRVKEVDLAELAERNEVPVQKIGQEWRFLRQALEDWLASRPFTNKLLERLGERLAQDLKLAFSLGPKPGSKEAVLKYWGVFADDNDLDEQLAKLKAIRESYG